MHVDPGLFPCMRQARLGPDRRNAGGRIAGMPGAGSPECQEIASPFGPDPPPTPLTRVAPCRMPIHARAFGHAPGMPEKFAGRSLRLWLRHKLRAAPVRGGRRCGRRAGADRRGACRCRRVLRPRRAGGRSSPRATLRTASGGAAPASPPIPVASESPAARHAVRHPSCRTLSITSLPLGRRRLCRGA